jgi:hypothetical protein
MACSFTATKAVVRLRMRSLRNVAYGIETRETALTCVLNCLESVNELRLFARGAQKVLLK